MITLEYPGYAPTVSLEIQSPEKGDADTPEDQLIILKTQSGNYKSIVNTPFKTNYLNTLVFSACREQKDEILEFLKAASKEYIRYTDYNNQVWMCQMISPNIDITNTFSGIEFSIDVRKWQ